MVVLSPNINHATPWLGGQKLGRLDQDLDDRIGRNLHKGRMGGKVVWEGQSVGVMKTSVKWTSTVDRRPSSS